MYLYFDEENQEPQQILWRQPTFQIWWRGIRILAKKISKIIQWSCILEAPQFGSFFRISLTSHNVLKHEDK